MQVKESCRERGRRLAHGRLGTTPSSRVEGRIRSLIVGCAFAVTLSAAPSVTAQTTSTSGQAYPTKPITIVVPFSAGGPTDTLARIMSDRLRKALGQPIIVDNTLGAGGSIGTGKVAKAPPDGYMVSIGHWGTHVVNGVYYNLPFNVLTDFEPVAMIASNPQVIISKNAVPAKTLTELNAWIVANQNKALMGTGGVGGASHMAAIYYGNRIGVKFQYVPYKGGAPALQALLGGEIDLYVTQVSNIAGQVKSGKVRAYAVTAPTRQAAAPDIPTVDEAGLPGLHTAIWHGLWLPKGTPKDVVAKLNAAVVETLGDPGVRARFVRFICRPRSRSRAGLVSSRFLQGAEPWPSATTFYTDVEDLAAYRKKIVAAGGRILIEEQEVPGMGTLSALCRSRRPHDGDSGVMRRSTTTRS